MKENISIAIALIVTLSLLLGLSIGQNYYLYKKVQHLTGKTYYQNIISVESLPHAERELNRAKMKLESKLMKIKFQREKEVLQWKLKNCDRIQMEQAVELPDLEEVYPNEERIITRTYRCSSEPNTTTITYTTE